MRRKSYRSLIISFGLALVLGISAFGQEQSQATIKLGVALPKVNFTDGANNGQMAQAVRSAAAQYFQGSNIEVVQIEAMLPNAVAGEAKEKGCQYVLQIAVSQKKGGGGFGMFKAIAPVLSSVAPMAGISGNLAGQVAGSVASQAIMSAASMSSSTKSKDTFTFDYALVTLADNSVKVTNSLKAKAKSDGEDVLSPMLESMAEAILTATK
jgi:hypothetical protein